MKSTKVWSRGKDGNKLDCVQPDGGRVQVEHRSVLPWPPHRMDGGLQGSLGMESGKSYHLIAIPADEKPGFYHFDGEKVERFTLIPTPQKKVEKRQVAPWKTFDHEQTGLLMCPGCGQVWENLRIADMSDRCRHLTTCPLVAFGLEHVEWTDSVPGPWWTKEEAG